MDAAYHDIVDAILTDVQLHEIGAGTMAPLRGPDEATRLARDFEDQKQRAKDYASAIATLTKSLESTGNSFMVETNSTHRPDKWKPTKRKRVSINEVRARAEDIRRYSSSSEDEIVFNTSAKCLKRRRSKRSKRFQSSLSKALREKFELLSYRKDDLGIYCDVKGNQDNYFVTISNNPSCNCPYYLCKQNNVVQICKHLAWVYVKIIGLSTDDDAIHQVALDGRELKRILDKAPHFTPTTVAETTPTQPRLHMPSVNTLLPYTLATSSAGVTANSTCLSSPVNVSTQPVPTMCNTVPVFTHLATAIQGPGQPTSAIHFPVVTLPVHTSPRPGNSGNFQGILTDAEVKGIF